jgi:mono/diheme cytochrome c family protein
MADQPRYDTYAPSPLFRDGKAGRPLPTGVVARGHLRDDPHFYEGRKSADGDLADTFPFPVTMEVIQRGRERYTISCVPCHAPDGSGNGRIVERGYTRPPSYHLERLRDAPVGHFFDVMTRGYNAMPDYAAEVTVRDRWAIAAYIRVLQRSQVPVAELSPAEREQLPPRGGGAAHE